MLFWYPYLHVILTPLTFKQLNDLFHNVILFSNVSHYKCNFLVWTGSKTMNVWSVLWLLMAWCFSTRASVATVVITHPCVSSCLGVYCHLCGSDYVQSDLLITHFFLVNTHKTIKPFFLLNTRKTHLVSPVRVWNVFCEVTDDNDWFKLVQVMAWHHQATSHYRCWPSYVMPYGINRPQWVNYIPRIRRIGGCYGFTSKPPAARNGVNAITQKPRDGLFSNLVYTLVVIVSWPD